MNALALNASPVFVILCKHKFAKVRVLGELPQWGVPVEFMGGVEGEKCDGEVKENGKVFSILAFK